MRLLYLTFKNLIHHCVVPLVSPAGLVTSRENDTQSFSNTLGFTTLPQRGRLLTAARPLGQLRIAVRGCPSLLLWEKGDRLRWMRSWLRSAQSLWHNEKTLFSTVLTPHPSFAPQNPPSPTGEGALSVTFGATSPKVRGLFAARPRSDQARPLGELSRSD